MRARVRFCRLRSGPRKMNEPMGRLGSLRPARERRMALATRSRAAILADDALAQALFHRDQLLDFAFEHFRDRDSGPLGDDARDVFFVDFFFQHALAALALHLLAELGQFLLRLAESGHSEFRRRARCCLCVASACSSAFSFSICSLRARTRAMRSFSFFQLALSVLDFSRISASSFSMIARRSREFASSSFFSACFSISSCVALRSS